MYPAYVTHHLTLRWTGKPPEATANVIPPAVENFGHGVRRNSTRDALFKDVLEKHRAFGFSRLRPPFVLRARKSRRFQGPSRFRSPHLTATIRSPTVQTRFVFLLASVFCYAQPDGRLISRPSGSASNSAPVCFTVQRICKPARC